MVLEEIVAAGWHVPVLAALGGAILAVAALALLTRLSDPLRWQARRAMRSEEGLVFLMDAAGMVDVTPRARAVLERPGAAGSERDRLMHHLRLTFDGAAEALDGPLGEAACIEGPQGALFEAERAGDLVRVEITDPRPGRRDDTRIETASLRAMEDELDVLRTVAESAPWPCWHAARGGAILWVNAAYLDLADRAALSAGAPPVWPPPALFGAVPLGATRRMEVALTGGEARSFDCRAVPTEGGMLHFASPADEAVRAEARLEGFSRVLTQTFAQIDVALAIFDRDRRLATFNPALTDMTGLPADFLGGRPTLPALLDRLREARKMPEPNDYAEWRARVTSLEAGAGAGTFRETWTLPTGDTWRVTGRPHPEGAIALLFEDVTAQTALARQFRQEMEIGQALVEGMPGAVAVFDASGTLAMSNAAYAEMWDADPRRLTGDVTVSDALARWERRAYPSPSWEALRAVLSAPGGLGWTGEALLRDGRRVSCRARPLPMGASMVSFDTMPSMPHGLSVVAGEVARA